MQSTEQYLVYVRCTSNPEFNKFFISNKAVRVEQTSLFHAMESVLDDVSEILMRVPGRPSFVTLESFVTQDRRLVLKRERTVYFRGHIVTTNDFLDPVLISFYEIEEKRYNADELVAEVPAAESPFRDTDTAAPAKWTYPYWCRLCGAIVKDTPRDNLDTSCVAIGGHQWQCYDPVLASYLESEGLQTPSTDSCEAVRGGHLAADTFQPSMCGSCELYYCRHNPIYQNTIAEMPPDLLADNWKRHHLDKLGVVSRKDDSSEPGATPDTP
jgi:hypothetical protein